MNFLYCFDSNATYIGSSSSEGATITISASGLQALTNGSSYTLTADVSDAAGNAAAQVTSSAFTVDTTAPTVASFTTATATGSYNADEAIVITANTSEAIQNDNTLSLIHISSPRD